MPSSSPGPSDPPKPSIFRRNVQWQIVGTGSQAVLSGLILWLQGRQLGATGFGYFAIIMGYVVVANMLVEPRMQDVAARHFWDVHDDPDLRDDHRVHFLDFLALESVLKLMPLATLALLSVPLADLANLPPGSSLLIVIAAAGNFIAKVGFGVTTGLLRVLGRTDQFTYCGSGELAVRLLVMLLITHFAQLTVANCIAVMAATLALSNIVQVWLAFRHARGTWEAARHWRPSGARARLAPYRRLLWSNAGMSATDLMNKDLDIALLAPVLPAHQIGIYKMAKNIAFLTWRAIDPFYLALMPELSRRVLKGQHDGTRQLLRRSSLGLGALAVAMSVGAFGMVYFFGTLLLGAGFADLPSIVIWMLLGVIAGAPFVWGHPLAVALNRADLAFLGSLLGFIVGLCAIYILVYFLGLRGAAISWMLTFVPGFLFTAAASYRLFQKQAQAT
jgi:O-antigen/teichoic acid export membrane protein